MMTRSLEASQDLKQTPKKDWIWKWAGQIVLLVNEIEWTHNVELAIRKSKSDGLWKEFEQEEEKLNQLVEIIRGDLSEIELITIGSLIVLDVHAKDVVESLMQ